MYHVHNCRSRFWPLHFLQLCAMCLLFCLTSKAGSSEPLNLQSATNALNAELYSTEKVVNKSPVQAREFAQQTLQLDALRFTPKLDGVLESLVRLSQRAEDCAAECADKFLLRQELNRLINRDVGTAVVLLPSNDQSTQIYLFDDLLQPHCSSKASVRCSRATELAINLWQMTGSFRALSKQLSEKDITISNTHLSKLDQQWRSYKDDSIKLWPHETLLSSLVFKQNNQGFSAPPNYKLLALRPALGLSYFSDGSPDLRPSINIDLLGVYWWQYQGANAGPGRGISATAVWGGDDTALGLTYHHGPNLSVTLANSNENDVVLSVSVQFAKWLLR